MTHFSLIVLFSEAQMTSPAGAIQYRWQSPLPAFLYMCVPSGDNSHTVNPAGAIWQQNTHAHRHWLMQTHTKQLSHLQCVCCILLVHSGQSTPRRRQWWMLILCLMWQQPGQPDRAEALWVLETHSWVYKMSAQAGSCTLVWAQMQWIMVNPPPPKENMLLGCICQTTFDTVHGQGQTTNADSNTI